jgi:hypothetical protein
MKRPTAAALTLCLAGASLFGIASVASASCTTGGSLFKAHDALNCSDTEMIASNASPGNTVEVQDDRTSSAKNATTNKWCFVNKAFVDSTIFTLAPSTAVNNLGTETNKTDHFDVVNAGGGCPA